MLHLRPVIDRIKTLLAEGSDSSVTYAALEARLALEKVCYDRLRQRHDYISHAQLRRWQPGAVVTTLMKEVDPHITETVTLSMSKQPTGRGSSVPEDQEWVTFGTQVGFDANKIAKMWQALAHLALHVRLPTNSKDQIPAYGDAAAIRAKVTEVLAELENLAVGTIATSGFGEEVSFICSCGETNRRRTKLLTEGREVMCMNPDCHYTWRVTKTGDEFQFESVNLDIECDKCGETNHTPARFFLDMRPDQTGSFNCYECQHKN